MGKKIPMDYMAVLEVLSAVYDEVDGHSFYRYIFPNNEKQGERNTDFSKPNAIYLYKDDKDKGTQRRLRRRIMLSDTWEQDYMDYVERNESTLCSGLTYHSRANRLECAQQMNALVIDLDGVGMDEIRTLLLRFGQPAENIRTLPIPTFLVASGTGVHVYYVFEEPIDLFPNIKLQMKALKYDLTFRMWDYKSTSKEKSIQYQSINQGFRMVGSINEKHDTVLRAFQIGGRVSLEYINSYVKPDSRVDINRRFGQAKMTKAQAKEKYPEWYQRVVVEKRKRLKKWDIQSKQGYALYEWWLNRVNEVTGGHRYYYLMCLVIYACKCDVPKAKLKEDIYTVYEVLRQIDYKNELTEDDIRSALEAYSKEYYNFKIDDIEKLTELRIDRNKRNGRRSMEHLQEEFWIENGRKRINVCKANRELALQGMRENGEILGRPSAEKKVIDYLREHPNAKKAEVIRGTGLSKPTVYKYYEAAKEKASQPESEVEESPFI